MRKFFTLSDPVFPVHTPRVLVETAVAQGARRDALYENTGLTPEMLTSPDMRISYMQYGALAGNALRLTGNPALGLHIGRNVGIAQMGAFGFLLLSSPNLRAALQATIRYNQSVAPGWTYDFQEEGGVMKLAFGETVPVGPFQAFCHEIMLGAFDTQGRSLYGGPLPVRKVSLPYPEPSYSREYRTLFYDVTFLFDQPEAVVEMDAAALDAPVAFADPATQKLAEQVCAQVMPEDLSREGLVAQIRRMLDTSPGAPPSLEEIAQTLQTSTRSLRRELRNVRTSYKELLDDSRRVRAVQWMETNSLPLERLATGLGFSHVRSFRRAFKRWTGRTPGASRAREH